MRLILFFCCSALSLVAAIALIAAWLSERGRKAAAKEVARAAPRNGSQSKITNLAIFALTICCVFTLQLGLLYLQNAVGVFKGMPVTGLIA